MRRSLILDTVTRGAFPPLIVFSLYLLFVGHNAPGGGFVGGLTAGTAFVLLYAGGGIERIHDVTGIRYELLLGAGLLLAGGTGLGSLAFHEPFLTSAILRWHAVLLGGVKVVTVLFFDIGVYLIVVGLVLALLTVLGDDARDVVAEQPTDGRPTDRRPTAEQPTDGRPTGGRAADASPAVPTVDGAAGAKEARR